MSRRQVVHGAFDKAEQMCEMKKKRFRWEVLNHPPYIPVLAPSDFNLFGPLIKYIGGQNFGTDAEAQLTKPSGFIIDGTGNYSVDMQCTWLIESSSPNSTIRLEIAHFETECSWDHLYIFDGDSVFSRLLAAYSRKHNHHKPTPDCVPGDARNLSDAIYSIDTLIQPLRLVLTSRHW
ncbi:attractin [Trichonephila clavipes]|nr:attractin [Trichonephila clavipes]